MSNLALLYNDDEIKTLRRWLSDRGYSHSDDFKTFEASWVLDEPLICVQNDSITGYFCREEVQSLYEKMIELGLAPSVRVYGLHLSIAKDDAVRMTVSFYPGGVRA